LLRILICGLVAAATLAYADDPEQHIHKVVKATNATQLYVEVDSGAIHVHPGSSGSAEVEVTFRGGRSRADLDTLMKYYDLDVELQGTDVRVRGKFREGHKPWQNDAFSLIAWIFGDTNAVRQIEYDITVPSHVGASLHTAGGSIEAEGLMRNVTANTSGGSIHLWNISGTADVNTSGGSITMDQIGGFVIAHTSGGAIRLHDLAAGVDASTSGGSVTAAFLDQPARGCRLTTSGGSINIGLGQSVHMDINASASGGRVSTDFNLPIDRHRPNELRAALNGGGPELYLHTSGGGIRIFHGEPAGAGHARNSAN